VVAMIKGYKSDDVYPGFGEIHRRLKTALTHREKKIEAIKNVNNVIDKHCRQAISSSQSIREKVGTYKNSILRSEEILLRLSQFVDSAEVVCNNVLWEYRSANVQVRSSEPPAYFSQKHTFANYKIDSDFTKEKENCQRIEARLDEIQNNENRKLHEGLRVLNEKALKEMEGVFGESLKDTGRQE
ncbi:MAG: hypothetical protein MI684_04010, partial [Chlorobiales bacterium]|nr:hypothetical protein [Chlorobiales bacterium]